MSRTGVMFFTDQIAGANLVAFAKMLDQGTLDTLWLPELFGREVFSSAAFVLANTARLHVASGIANVYARDALSICQATQTLAEFSQGRFVLGLGVSNPQIVTARGQDWRAPLAKMSEYFDVAAKAKVYAPPPAAPAPVYVAAHGPKLLALAATRADGANTYLMTVEHTAKARRALGDNKQLNVVQHCLLSDLGAQKSRALARSAIKRYIALDYYCRAWRDLGFIDNDFSDGGSDRLVDALVAWGDVGRINHHIQCQREAGADEVIVVPLNPAGGGQAPDYKMLAALEQIS
jgi:probable F420-dependent oxidoreductase